MVIRQIKLYSIKKIMQLRNCSCFNTEDKDCYCNEIKSIKPYNFKFFFLINKTVQIFFTINGELKVVMEPRKRVQCAEHCIYIYALDKFNIVEKEQRNLGILSEKKRRRKKK